MAKRLVFLQLAPEFGATKFGPFQGAEVRLGSDPSRNDIVLPEALGVMAEHARLIKQPDESFVLAPVERTASIHLWRADGRPPKQVTAPIALVGGDGFSLVSAEGPRFFILLETQKQAAESGSAKDSLGRAKKKLGKKSLMEEIKRQGLTRALTTGAGQALNNAWTFVRTGAILQPRYIIGGIMLASGWILAGAASCTIAGMAYNSQSQAAELDEVKGDLSACTGSTADGGDLTLSDVVGQMLGDSDYTRALADDPKLRQLVKERLKVVLANRERFMWVHKRKSSPYVEFRRRLDSSSLPPQFTRVLSYAAALEGFNRDREWEYVIDSEAKEVCGRGPLLLTFRQAKNLDFGERQLDAPMDARMAAQENVSDMVAALRATAGEPVEIDEGEIDFESGGVQGGGQCVYMNGEDDRRDVNRIVKKLERELGAKTPGLPDEGRTYWLTMRLLKLYSADFQRGYEDVKLDQGLAPSVVLDSASTLTDSRKDYALKNMADVIAKATALPCLAMMDKATQSPAEEIAKDFPKSKIQCGLLLFMIEEDV